MRNEKLITFMSLKEMTKKQLSEITGISMTTLNRIVNGETQKIKLRYMEAIAKALDTSVPSIFEVPSEIPYSTAIRPDEIGRSVTKVLNPNETMFLYWFQNMYEEGQAAILKHAKAEHQSTQNSISRKYYAMNMPDQGSDEFSQLSLELSNQ